MKEIIRTQKLNFSYGSRKVIDNLSLIVPENSIYGFLGENGAGKSTTIKILLGLHPCNSGSIVVFDKDYDHNRNEILSQIGNLIETPTLYPHLTAYESLKYADYLHGMGEERITQVLMNVGLWEHRHKKVKHLSTGMKQRLGIGLVIFHKPRLLILDEPINGLDPNGVVEMRKLLLSIWREGVTIFMSSHILSEIERLCTHIGIIKQGGLIYQGEMSKLLSTVSKSVFVRTSNNDRSFTLLSTLYHVKSTINGELKVEVYNDSEFNQIISLLFNNQIEIYAINTSSTNLEEIFVELNQVVL